MSDTQFERERPALEQMPLPFRRRVEVIGAARSIIEAMAHRFEEPEAVKSPTLVPLDLVAQVQSNEAESTKELTKVAAQQAVGETTSAEAIDGLDTARRLVEKSYEAA